MNATLTLQQAYDRLDEILPDWRYCLSSPGWITRWMEASGDSRATAYRMQDRALEIDELTFDLFVEQHPEIPRHEMIEAYNDHYGIPCAWKLRPARRSL